MGDNSGNVQLITRTNRADGNMVVAVGAPNTFFAQPSQILSVYCEPGCPVEIHLLANWDRQNAAAGGSGQYQFLIDSTPVGSVKETVGNVRTTISLTDVFTITVPGVHPVNVRCTAITGNETVFDFAVLTALCFTRA